MLMNCFESVVCVSYFNISINSILCQWNTICLDILSMIYIVEIVMLKLGGKLMWIVGK